jgi:hypothetical protein
MVSMLWETVNPAEALNERFRTLDAASATDWMTEAVWNTWAMAIRDCERLVISDHNLLAWVTADDQHVILEWSDLPGDDVGDLRGERRPHGRFLLPQVTTRLWSRWANGPLAVDSGGERDGARQLR